MEAAASIVLSPALQVIFDRLASPALEKLGDIWGATDNRHSLRRALMRVQATLEDAEEQQLSNKAVRLWLSNLKNAACDAEDLLEFFTAREKIQPGFETFEAEKIRKTLQKLEMTINEGLLAFSFGEPSMGDRRSAIRETVSCVFDSKIYGREDDQERLVKLLLSSETTLNSYATCIPIIGIGGIGKTTLAQLAYNDERVLEHFDTRMWVFVSEDFDVKKIMKTVIESATKDECKLLGIEQLQSRLLQLLHKKRYLIVLDDIWTDDQDDWDKLRPLFGGGVGVDGSKIIVTTRSKKVPSIMDFPNSPLHLNGLTAEDCWALFKQRAFGQGDEEKYPNLSLIGKQIVKKCGGVPLAAKSLGSSVRLKREEKQWLFMRDCELWELNESEYKVLPALMLSYHHLPSHLRQCFAFCSIFPKNYEFKKQKLIHLWMAEGLIPLEGSKRPEDIGDEYFSELLWMSFLQEGPLGDSGGLIGYKMNDVIHDLARHVAGKESVILEHGVQPHCPAEIRHSSIVYGYRNMTIPKALFEAEHLRTLLLVGDSGMVEFESQFGSSFKYLRVLDLNSCYLFDQPESLAGLVCLRYLDLSYTSISKLPDSMRYLFYLQTLNLRGCHKLESLPYLGCMWSLRHLNLSGCVSLTHMPAGIQMLSQLQTLPHFVAGSVPHFVSVSGPHFVSDSRNLITLENLNLYGKLNITRLENVQFLASAILKMKENLLSLGLYWGVYPGFEDVDESFAKLPKARPEVGVSPSRAVPEQHSSAILGHLQPHKNLKKLVINGYPGIGFPKWELPNLITIDITNCKNCQSLPALGNLLLLKNISLHGMNAVKRIGTEFYGDGTDRGFSSLEELSLSDFPNLEEWSSANNSFPSLRKLTVKRCPKLTQIPLSQCLQHLELRDCNPSLMSIANLSLLSVLVLEKIPDLLSLPEGLFASACLSSLNILSCPKLHSLPSEMGNLAALKSLTIRWCEDLSSLPQSLQNLKALESLEIGDCHSLISLPDGGIGGLSSLRTLSIENCSKLRSLSSSLENLAFLEHLTIMYCPNLGSFPEGVQHLSALRSLIIMSCPWFDSLPNGLQNSRRLHSLEISSCPTLAAFPDWIENLDSLRSLTISDCPNFKALPSSFRLLTKLQYLSIQECPELEERYRQGSSGDWLTIAHVPHKYIGSPQVRQSGQASTSGSSSV